MLVAQSAPLPGRSIEQVGEEVVLSELEVKFVEKSIHTYSGEDISAVEIRIFDFFFGVVKITLNTSAASFPHVRFFGIRECFQI